MRKDSTEGKYNKGEKQRNWKMWGMEENTKTGKEENGRRKGVSEYWLTGK